MRRLPEDLSELEQPEVAKACDERDRRLTILFRRWPKLSKPEMRELKRLYDERQRLARYVGFLRGAAARKRRQRTKA
jgi:hypothetical protein